MFGILQAVSTKMCSNWCCLSVPVEAEGNRQKKRNARNNVRRLSNGTVILTVGFGDHVFFSVWRLAVVSDAMVLVLLAD